MYVYTHVQGHRAPELAPQREAAAGEREEEALGLPEDLNNNNNNDNNNNNNNNSYHYYHYYNII